MNILFLGGGYCSEYIIKLLNSDVQILCTHKTENTLKAKAFKDPPNVSRILFSSFLRDEKILNQMTHILTSIPPTHEGDLAIDVIKKNFKKMKSLAWLGYFSTTGVYGNHNGEWVNEDTELKTQTTRSINRIKAESQYLELYKNLGTPTHIFRLPGIYGPGRSIFERIRDQEFKMIIKPNHFFSRIHVSDIASAVYLSMLNPTPGEIFNISDDYPCPSDEVTSYACKLLRVEEPLKVFYNEKLVSDFAKSFYNENRKVSNLKLKQKLKWKPQFENYKKGLKSILGKN